MRVDFNDIKEEIVNNFKGGKGSIALKMLTKKDVTFISARLKPNSSVGMHKHLTDSETIYIISGTGKTVCDGETEVLKAGSVTFCPVGYSHCLINDGDEDLVFFAVVPKTL
ncbi:MAG: cupin domain-containing protein [Clostridia bacterium]|nr:cupin domain-containing protein [Clostridia bacterium]